MKRAASNPPILLIALAVQILVATAADKHPDGDTLARQMRDGVPDKPIVSTATLKRRGEKNQRSTLPIRYQVAPEADGWRAIYEVVSTNHPAEKLTIIHRNGQTNQYLYAKADGIGKAPGEGRLLGTDGTMQPFGNTDFWIADLGIEFLHWPVQRIVKNEMKNSQACHVLESIRTNSPATGYTRVLSWVDIDTGGIVQAEAYNEKKQLVKEFSTRSVQKVAGEWQVKELEIRSKAGDTRTRLEFDLADP
ncbi:MAG TPA: outer membrane lipoprotein-sorting protein [Roseimicrobium sp.]|nr:outer membrane lipoprotein-sorting protein [Roseimicrobium sp.]